MLTTCAYSTTCSTSTGTCTGTNTSTGTIGTTRTTSSTTMRRGAGTSSINRDCTRTPTMRTSSTLANSITQCICEYIAQYHDQCEPARRQYVQGLEQASAFPPPRRRDRLRNFFGDLMIARNPDPCSSYDPLVNGVASGPDPVQGDRLRSLHKPDFQAVLRL